jgi:hypothetical protein
MFSSPREKRRSLCVASASAGPAICWSSSRAVLSGTALGQVKPLYAYPYEMQSIAFAVLPSDGATYCCTILLHRISRRPTIDLGSIAGLHAHNHQLAAYCPRCDAWRVRQRSRRITQGSRVMPASNLSGTRWQPSASGQGSSAASRDFRRESAEGWIWLCPRSPDTRIR